MLEREIILEPERKPVRTACRRLITSDSAARLTKEARATVASHEYSSPLGRIGRSRKAAWTGDVADRALRQTNVNKKT